MGNRAAQPPERADAVVLAGGRASRMGGVDKPGIVVGGRSLLDAALAAVAGCARIAVVGPERAGLGPAVHQTREQPPGSGPVAALAAGLAALGAEPAPLVVVLAADLPFLTADTVRRLIEHLGAADAAFAADRDGRPQYLIGVWRRSALDAALAGLGSPVNHPMKALVPAASTVLELPGTDDCDTAEQVLRARTVLGDTLDDARAALRTGLTPLPARGTALAAARGAALAEPLRAAGPLPRFDVSAMDGYAVAGPGPWRIRRDIGYAGGERPAGLEPGEAVRIATGAHVPDGTTRVVRDEFAGLLPGTAADPQQARTDTLALLPDSPLRDDIRHRGEDRAPGDEIAPANTPITTALISAAASVEVTTATVRGPVRARIVMTGDEIRADGPLHAGQTRDSIGPVLPDLLATCGITTVDRVHLRDTAHGFDAVLDAAHDRDLLVVVGATGGGAADQLRGAVARAGARILVPRLRLRPGGSTLVAETPGGTTILGLPGNPYAAVATLLALAPALVSGRTGATPNRTLRGPLHNAAEIAAAVPRVVPARYAPGGGFLGDPAIRTAHLGGLVGRDGLVVVPAGAADGALVEFLPLSR
ncbi:NTP transferase domain-containing protein [Nocardia asteroides]|uniref:NTP transferase domain-containing protein n=1 Tax=Nocardia asteroides TaxID=1824 RepID=UPI001E3FD133|nr:NTP transferase domain-containing protein [Nocardia asteroides]UGT64049.1 NTP transferase domain-containing protein [Nocardia asteroides]